MTQFTKNHEKVLGIARTMIDKRDEVLKNSTTVNYNFLKELSIQRNERLITRLLKSILEFEIPTSEGASTHTTLLSSFIEEVLLVNDEDSLAEFSKLNKSKLSIELEHKIPSKIKDDLIYGQIDMVVHYELPSRDEDTNKKEYLPLIAIEVKIDAGDQYGQCSRYIRYMDGFNAKRKECFGFDKLIYLSIQGKNPTDYSFYDNGLDNEIDESIRVINKGFTSDVRKWLKKVKRRYKPYSTIESGNEEETKVSEKEEDEEVKEKVDGFRLALLSLIETIEDWDKGETLMNNMYKEIEDKYLEEAIEIAKVLQNQFETQKGEFLNKVRKNIGKQYAKNEISDQKRYDNLTNKYFKDNSHHLVWVINQEIYDEQLFLYLGTKGNSEKMYVGILDENLQGKKEKFLDFKKRDIISGIEGKYNSTDFIWWGNIMVNEDVLSFDNTNLDLLNPKSIPFGNYFIKTVNVINSIFDAFDKEKEDKTPISE